MCAGGSVPRGAARRSVRPPADWSPDAPARLARPWADATACAMPGAAMVSLKRCCAGVGVMRGCEPVAITRGPAATAAPPGTRGFVVLGSFGGGGFDFCESSFATVRKPQASASIGGSVVSVARF